MTFDLTNEATQNAIAGALAILIILGAMTMMFTNLWTTKQK